jgi:hypothetical protein
MPLAQLSPLPSKHAQFSLLPSKHAQFFPPQKFPRPMKSPSSERKVNHLELLEISLESKIASQLVYFFALNDWRHEFSIIILYNT